MDKTVGHGRKIMQGDKRMTSHSGSQRSEHFWLDAKKWLEKKGVEIHVKRNHNKRGVLRGGGSYIGRHWGRCLQSRGGDSLDRLQRRASWKKK